jgi:ribosomal protein S18 acetylase RimI-like enzyme
MAVLKSIPHERLQEFVVIDYTTDMVILAILQEGERETIVGVGQYGVHEETHTAEAAFAVRDDYQGQGIGKELVSYLTYLAQRQGLLGFTAEVLQENTHMLHLFESAGFDLEERIEDGVYQLKMAFRGTE